MKKLLLSSIIMFGVCGFVTAQNATGSKLGKTQATTTTSAAPTPQKAAVEPALATNDVDPVKPASTKTNAVAAPAANVKSAKVVKPAEAVAVSADGVIIANDAAKKKEIEKAEAAAAKKNNDN